MILISEEDFNKENLDNALDNLSVLSDDVLNALAFCATTILQEREYEREKELLNMHKHVVYNNWKTTSPDK